MKRVGKSFDPGSDVCRSSEAGESRLNSETKYSAAGLWGGNWQMMSLQNCIPYLFLHLGLYHEVSA